MTRGRAIHLGTRAGVLMLAAGIMGRASGAAAPITTPAPPLLTAGDGAVLVTYGGVLNAAGYNIYRRGADQTPDKAVKINGDKPDPFTWFIDDGGGKGLKDGAPLYYSVKAVLPDNKEGPASPETVVVPNPPLLGSLVTYTIGTLNPGSVTYDSAKKVITVRASGNDIWANADGQTFVGTPILGDFTLTARILAPPAYEDPGAARSDGKIGLEMRTSPEFGAPYAMVFASVMRDPEILFEGRMSVLGGTTFSAGQTDFADLKFPVWVRLSRADTIMTAQQSTDGTAWTNVTDPQDFAALPPVTFVGIGETAHDDTQYLDGQIDAASLSITTP
jgi:hypothetical protein